MLSIRCKCSSSSVQAVYYYHLHNNFQHHFLYSTKSSPNQNPKSPNQSCTNYLVNHLGFSLEQAQSTSTKLTAKNPNYSNFSNNANSVVDFLKQHSFDDTHIKKVVSSYPQILSANVDRTLKPKFQLFQDHGFSPSHLVSVISSNPRIVSANMVPIIRDLRAILGSNDNLIKFVKKYPLTMGPTALGTLNSNIAFLNNEYGVDINLIRNGMLKYPRSYFRNTESFRNIVVRVVEELGIPRDSGIFIYGMRLCSSSKKSIESRCQLFKSFGWTDYHVSELMRRNPLIFRVSEKNIRNKLGFLMTELGYKPDFLATHAVMLGSSLEKRLAPRHRVLLVLKDKGLLDYKLCTAIYKTEKQFLKIIEPFKEDVPGLLEIYQCNKGYSNTDAISRHQ